MDFTSEELTNIANSLNEAYGAGTIDLNGDLAAQISAFAQEQTRDLEARFNALDDIVRNSETLNTVIDTTEPLAVDGEWDEETALRALYSSLQLSEGFDQETFVNAFITELGEDARADVESYAQALSTFDPVKLLLLVGLNDAINETDTAALAQTQEAEAVQAAITEAVENSGPAVATARDWINTNREALNTLISSIEPEEIRNEIGTIAELPAELALDDEAFLRAFSSTMSLMGRFNAAGRTAEFPEGLEAAFADLEPYQDIIIALSSSLPPAQPLPNLTPNPTPAPEGGEQQQSATVTYSNLYSGDAQLSNDISWAVYAVEMAFQNRYDGLREVVPAIRDPDRFLNQETRTTIEDTIMENFRRFASPYYNGTEGFTSPDGNFTYIFDELGNIFTAQRNEDGTLARDDEGRLIREQNVGHITHGIGVVDDDGRTRAPHDAAVMFMDWLDQQVESGAIAQLTQDLDTEDEANLAIIEERQNATIEAFFNGLPEDLEEEFRSALTYSRGLNADTFAQSDLGRRIRDAKNDDGAYDTFIAAAFMMERDRIGLSSAFENFDIRAGEISSIANLLRLMAGNAYDPGRHASLRTNADIQDNILSLNAYEILRHMKGGEYISVDALRHSENTEALQRAFGDRTEVTREDVYAYVRREFEIDALGRLEPDLRDEIEALNEITDPTAYIAAQNALINANADILDTISQAMYDGHFNPYEEDVHLVFKAFERPGLQDPQVADMINYQRTVGTPSIPPGVYALNNLSDDELVRLTGDANFNDRNTYSRAQQIETLDALFQQDPQATMQSMLDSNLAQAEVYQRVVLNFYEPQLANNTWWRNGEITDESMDTWNGRYGEPNQDQLMHMFMRYNWYKIDRVFGADAAEARALFFVNPQTLNYDLTYEEAIEQLSPSARAAMDAGIADLSRPSMYMYMMELRVDHYRDMRNNEYIPGIQDALIADQIGENPPPSGGPDSEEDPDGLGTGDPEEDPANPLETSEEDVAPEATAEDVLFAANAIVPRARTDAPVIDEERLNRLYPDPNDPTQPRFQEVDPETGETRYVPAEESFRTAADTVPPATPETAGRVTPATTEAVDLDEAQRGLDAMEEGRASTIAAATAEGPEVTAVRPSAVPTAMTAMPDMVQPIAPDAVTATYSPDVEALRVGTAANPVIIAGNHPAIDAPIPHNMSLVPVDPPVINPTPVVETAPAAAVVTDTEIETGRMMTVGPEGYQVSDSTGREIGTTETLNTDGTPVETPRVQPAHSPVPRYYLTGTDIEIAPEAILNDSPTRDTIPQGNRVIVAPEVLPVDPATLVATMDTPNPVTATFLDPVNVSVTPDDVTLSFETAAATADDIPPTPVAPADAPRLNTRMLTNGALTTLAYAAPVISWTHVGVTHEEENDYETGARIAVATADTGLLVNDLARSSALSPRQVLRTGAVFAVGTTAVEVGVALNNKDGDGAADATIIGSTATAGAAAGAILASPSGPGAIVGGLIGGVVGTGVGIITVVGSEVDERLGETYYKSIYEGGWFNDGMMAETQDIIATAQEYQARLEQGELSQAEMAEYNDLLATIEDHMIDLTSRRATLQMRIDRWNDLDSNNDERLSSEEAQNNSRAAYDLQLLGMNEGIIRELEQTYINLSAAYDTQRHAGLDALLDGARSANDITRRLRSDFTHVAEGIDWEWQTGLFWNSQEHWRNSIDEIRAELMNRADQTVMSLAHLTPDEANDLRRTLHNTRQEVEDRIQNLLYQASNNDLSNNEFEELRLLRDDLRSIDEIETVLWGSTSNEPRVVEPDADDIAEMTFDNVYAALTQLSEEQIAATPHDLGTLAIAVHTANTAFEGATYGMQRTQAQMTLEAAEQAYEAKYNELIESGEITQVIAYLQNPTTEPETPPTLAEAREDITGQDGRTEELVTEAVPDQGPRPTP